MDQVGLVRKDRTHENRGEEINAVIFGQTTPTIKAPGYLAANYLCEDDWS